MKEARGSLSAWKEEAQCQEGAAPCAARTCTRLMSPKGALACHAALLQTSCASCSPCTLTDPIDR